jgi:hypothetical protein
VVSTKARKNPKPAKIKKRDRKIAHFPVACCAKRCESNPMNTETLQTNSNLFARNVADALLRGHDVKASKRKTEEVKTAVHSLLDHLHLNPRDATNV